MAKWGRREHKWESRTNWLLVLSALTQSVYWWRRWEWMLYISLCSLAITLLAHAVARFSHWREKVGYKRFRR